MNCVKNAYSHIVIKLFGQLYIWIECQFKQLDNNAVGGNCCIH